MTVARAYVALQVASTPAHGGGEDAALAPLLGDCFVVLAQLFAAMQFIGEHHVSCQVSMQITLPFMHEAATKLLIKPSLALGSQWRRSS